jgi:hypothetical protein
MIGAISVRNRCDLMDTTGHQKAKKNRHTLGFPVCGGVLNGGLAIESSLQNLMKSRL